ncbi:multidrug effflux MFS transporter [Raineyella fluvialis]|uniref:Bcr/CflA family efflux MFS transporter n=1 Tax=Raineyella fluvialis TaxID=2662261 RepID=A0A5Q2FBP9_9ACTN|nr:multidrug effflux MFS transporter [Raineyella fluvialis]QGF24168.1 Bcr/CflA family efflux MFS transporter [Raineyella fluvialis]
MASALSSGEPIGRTTYVRLVVVLGLLAAIGPLSTDVYLPAFPDMARELSASHSQIQATLAGSLIGLGVGQLITGPLSDALGRRIPVITGMSAHVVLSIGCAMAADVRLLIALRVLQGLAGTASAITAMAVVRDLFTGERAASLMSRLMLVMGLAPVLAPSVGGFMLRLMSWQGTFVFLAVAGLVLMLAALFFLPETLPAEHRTRLHPSVTAAAYLRLFRDPVVIAMVIGSAAGAGTLFSYISGSSFILQGQYGLSPQVYALVFGGIGLSLVVGGQLNPVLLRRFGLARTEFGATVASVLVAAVMVLLVSTGAGGVVGFVAPLPFAMALVAMHNANLTVITLHRQGRTAGTAAALLGAVRFGVGGVMAPVVGLVTRDSPTPLAVILLATSLVGLTAFMVVRPRLAGYLH